MKQNIALIESCVIMTVGQGINEVSFPIVE